MEGDARNQLQSRAGSEVSGLWHVGVKWPQGKCVIGAPIILSPVNRDEEGDCDQQDTRN